MSRERLCALDDIPDGGSIGAKGMVDGEEKALTVVRQGDEVFVYVNSCPHIGAPLDFAPGQFLDLTRTHIICSNHAALFRIEDGFCIRGPCHGRSLEPVPAAVENGIVHLIH